MQRGDDAEDFDYRRALTDASVSFGSTRCENATRGVWHRNTHRQDIRCSLERRVLGDAVFFVTELLCRTLALSEL